MKKEKDLHYENYKNLLMKENNKNTNKQKKYFYVHGLEGVYC